MPGFTKDILGKRVSRIDLYQIFHDEDTWFFNVCVIKLKYAYSTLLLNIYKETDKQKHQYNCLSWTGCFFHKHCFFLNKQQEDKFLLFRHIYLYLADIFSKINEVSLSLQKKYWEHLLQVNKYKLLSKIPILENWYSHDLHSFQYLHTFLIRLW